MTPNIQVVRDWVVANHPGYTHIGITNCRKIEDSQTYSQHSWSNALDIHCSPAYGDALVVALVEEFGDAIYELLWRVAGHYDHIHVSTWPKGWLTPPCAGGTQRIKYENGTATSGPFPLTIVDEGDDDMDFVISVLQGQNMAFYRSMKAKTGAPGGNPDYWGSDYAGAKPSAQEWKNAAPVLFGAALQCGVFAEAAGVVDAVARDQVATLKNNLHQV